VRTLDLHFCRRFSFNVCRYFCRHWVFIRFYSDHINQILQLWFSISFQLTNSENSWSEFLSAFLFRRLSVFLLALSFYSDHIKANPTNLALKLTNSENSWSSFLSAFLFRRLSGKSSGQSGFDGKTRKMITDANADNKTGFICNSLNLQLNLQLKLLIVITVIKAVYWYHIGIYV